jgi:N-acetylmuramoyl-L-alanine amidase
MLTINNARIRSNSFRPRTEPVDTLVLHYTALDLATSLRVLRDQGVSAHYVLAEDGTAYRILEDNEVAYHAGVSMWRGKTGVNARSIGVEIVNLDGNEYEYPAVQIAALIELCRMILERNPGISPGNVVGHSDVAPKRKVDPGAKFPWQQLADAGIGRWPTDIREEPVGTAPEIQSLLEACGYPKEHAYGMKGEGFTYVADPGNPPADVTKVVRVSTQDILEAFQLRYQPGNVTGAATTATMGMLRTLAAQ